MELEELHEEWNFELKRANSLVELAQEVLDQS